jgi:serine/threonine protein kinase
MSSRVERLHIGPYQLVRQLEGSVPAERWLAFNQSDQTTHVAYRFKLSQDKSEQRRFIAAVEAMSPLSHPHLLPIEQFSLVVGGGAWIVTPYTGSHDGLVTLSALVRDKGGRLEPQETERALIQLLEAMEHAHSEGHVHGALRAEEILVDRRGSLSVELYGLRRRLGAMGGTAASEVIRDEVRSLVGLGYWLLTGLPAEDPRIEAGRLIPRLDRRWDDWFNEGLDPLGGFATAGETLAGLPGIRRGVEGRERVGPVRTVLGRMRRALTSNT